MILATAKFLFGTFYGASKENAELQLLSKLPFEFHVTGSHFFGCATAESDFDFIAEDTPELRTALADAGFASVCPEEYMEDWERDCLTNDVWGKGKVHVQLSNDVPKLCAVRDILAKYLPEQHRNAGRESRCYLWGTLAELLTFGS